MLIKRLATAAFISLSLLSFQYGFAATQGTLGATSTGSVVIQLTIPGLVQISGLSDITLAPTDFSVDASGNTTACIYSNSSTLPGGYTVTASSTNGGAGNFIAVSGGNNLNYTATWDDGGGATALTSGSPLGGQTGADQSQTDCGGSPNATFAVTFTAANMQAAPQGVYTDTVTLLVAPA